MFEKQRQEMVQKYVIEAGITDARIVEAMRKVPRHEFVEEALKFQAYSGKSLPIGFGQTISHPTTVARMTQALQLRKGERILEIGTGSGYQAAILAMMGAKVFTIERIPALAQKARKIFEKLGLYSIAVQIGDGSKGWTEFAPYDGIMVTAASPDIPGSLVNQLKLNGRLILPVGDREKQQLKIIVRKKEELEIISGGVHSFVPLIGREGWKLNGT